MPSINESDLHYQFYKEILTRLSSVENKEDVDYTDLINEKVTSAKTELTGQLESLTSSVNSKLNEKLDKEVFTTNLEEIDDTLKLKANSADVYTKAQVDTELGKKANNDQVNTIYGEVQGNKQAITTTQTNLDNYVNNEHDILEALKNEGLWG